MVVENFHERVGFNCWMVILGEIMLRPLVENFIDYVSLAYAVVVFVFNKIWLPAVILDS